LFDTFVYVYYVNNSCVPARTVINFMHLPNYSVPLQAQLAKETSKGKKDGFDR